MLLRTEPFVFEGSTIVFTELGRRPQSTKQNDAKSDTVTSVEHGNPALTSDSLAFAPRTARKMTKAISKGRQAPKVDKALPVSLTAVPVEGRGQDDFRAVVDLKNKQREGKLVERQAHGEKRTATAGDENAAKRAKIEE